MKKKKRGGWEGQHFDILVLYMLLLWLFIRLSCFLVLLEEPMVERNTLFKLC